MMFLPTAKPYEKGSKKSLPLQYLTTLSVVFRCLIDTSGFKAQKVRPQLCSSRCSPCMLQTCMQAQTSSLLVVCWQGTTCTVCTQARAGEPDLNHLLVA